MRRSLTCIFGILAAIAASSPGFAQANQGKDFIDDARLFYRVVACADDSPPPAGFDAVVVDAHCKSLRKKIERFHRRYMKRAVPFIAKYRPAGLPTRVVYPFGGGDLVSALITYPDLTEVTTISLENSGDPRRLAALSRDELEEHLTIYNDLAGHLLKRYESASANLRKLERGPIPGQLSFFLLALAVHDLEPVSLKFFRIEADGSLHYYTQEEIDGLDSTQATKLAKKWVDADYSVAFRNVEISFRARGAGPGEPLRVHRHIAYNLDDDHFGQSPLLAHLKAKGRISAMTKAASYLLWSSKFSAIRSYLLNNMEFMVSDSTGIRPKHAKKAGFYQITFGKFTGPFLEWASTRGTEAFIELWETNRKRRLPFRYGYPDAEGHFHMLITRPYRKKSPPQ